MSFKFDKQTFETPQLDTNKRLEMLLHASKQQLASIDSILLGRIVSKGKDEGEDLRTCTQAEAAKMLKVSYSTVHRMVKNGRLRTITLNMHPRILLSSVHSLAA